MLNSRGMAAKTLVVLDSNVLLHFRLLDEIPWPSLVGAEEVVIVLVPAVLHDLDNKKNGSSDKLKKRAQRLFSAINRWFPAGKTREDARIREGVGLRLVHLEPTPFPGLDYSVFDDRIVGSALGLRSDAARIVVFTGDILMRVKMENHDFEVLEVPETYRLKDDDETKPVPVKRPRLIPGLYSGEVVEPTSFTTVEVGLSAARLLPSAYEELAALESPVYGSRATYIDFKLFGRGQPTPERYRDYIESILKYDRDNARVITFRIGVTNAGEAPAEDIAAEFRFPADLHVTDDEPVWPERPDSRDLRDLASLALARDPHPRDMRSFDLDYRSGAFIARFRAARLMQTTRMSRQLWARIDEPLGGFPINARVLIGNPADKVEAMMNIQIVDRAESAA